MGRDRYSLVFFFVVAVASVYAYRDPLGTEIDASTKVLGFISDLTPDYEFKEILYLAMLISGLIGVLSKIAIIKIESIDTETINNVFSIFKTSPQNSFGGGFPWKKDKTPRHQPQEFLSEYFPDHVVMKFKKNLARKIEMLLASVSDASGIEKSIVLSSNDAEKNNMAKNLLRSVYKSITGIIEEDIPQNMENLIMEITTMLNSFVDEEARKIPLIQGRTIGMMLIEIMKNVNGAFETSEITSQHSSELFKALTTIGIFVMTCFGNLSKKLMPKIVTEIPKILKWIGKIMETKLEIPGLSKWILFAETEMLGNSEGSSTLRICNKQGNTTIKSLVSLALAFSIVYTTINVGIPGEFIRFSMDDMESISESILRLERDVFDILEKDDNYRSETKRLAKKASIYMFCPEEASKKISYIFRIIHCSVSAILVAIAKLLGKDQEITLNILSIIPRIIQCLFTIPQLSYDELAKSKDNTPEIRFGKEDGCGFKESKGEFLKTEDDIYTLKIMAWLLSTLEPIITIIIIKDKKKLLETMPQIPPINVGKLLALLVGKLPSHLLKTWIIILEFLLSVNKNLDFFENDLENGVDMIETVYGKIKRSDAQTMLKFFLPRSLKKNSDSKDNKYTPSSESKSKTEIIATDLVGTKFPELTNNGNGILSIFSSFDLDGHDQIFIDSLLPHFFSQYITTRIMIMFMYILEDIKIQNLDAEITEAFNELQFLKGTFLGHKKSRETAEHSQFPIIVKKAEGLWDQIPKIFSLFNDEKADLKENVEGKEEMRGEMKEEMKEEEKQKEQEETPKMDERKEKKTDDDNMKTPNKAVEDPKQKPPVENNDKKKDDDLMASIDTLLNSLGVKKPKKSEEVGILEDQKPMNQTKPTNTISLTNSVRKLKPRKTNPKRGFGAFNTFETHDKLFMDIEHLLNSLNN